MGVEGEGASYRVNTAQRILSAGQYLLASTQQFRVQGLG